MTAGLPDGPPPWVMGVVNVTPDSFTDGGLYLDADSAVAQGRALVAAGADVIDLGGAATGPGTGPIPAQEEWGRLAPVVAVLAPEALLSVDTYRAAVAGAALDAGVRMVNDMSATRADPGMIPLVAERGVPLVLGYAKDAPLPHVRPGAPAYGDVVRDVGDVLAGRVDACLAAGIAAERLFVDPGLGGFVSPDPGHSWAILERIGEMVERFRPVRVMIGTSRKSFLGGAKAARDPMSQLTGLLAAHKGVVMMRTHDAAMARAFVDAARRMGLALPAAAGAAA